VKQENIA